MALCMSVLTVPERLRWDRTIVKIVENHWNGWRISMRKKADSKQAKANKVLRASAVAASAESAIREPPPDTWPVRRPPYAYTSLCPDPGLRRLPKGVIRYHETVLHRQRAPRM